MNENDSKTNETNDFVNITQSSIYTQEEREKTVRSFIDAYISHRAYIDSTRFTHVGTASMSGMLRVRAPRLIVSTASSVYELRSIIEPKIKIATNPTSATPEVIRETINSLFNDIIEMQGRHYIYGSFLSNEEENRIFEKCKIILDDHVKRMRHELGLDDV